MSEFNIGTIKDRMNSSKEVYHKNLAGVRAGRASPDLLNNMKVDAYGSLMPLSQLATVSVADSNILVVQVWDNALLGVVDKAIQTSDLGLNPLKDGGVIRVPLPKLSEERRRDLVKVCATHAEQVKVAIRNIRRDEIDSIKKSEKAGDISEDDMRHNSVAIQKVTDEFIKEVDSDLDEKQREILKV